MAVEEHARDAGLSRDVFEAAGREPRASERARRRSQDLLPPLGAAHAAHRLAIDCHPSREGWFGFP